MVVVVVVVALVVVVVFVLFFYVDGGNVVDMVDVNVYRSFWMRLRISIRGRVRPSVRRSVCLVLFWNDEYGRFLRVNTK